MSNQVFKEKDTLGPKTTHKESIWEFLVVENVIIINVGAKTDNT
jgi:hypothetical protein